MIENPKQLQVTLKQLDRMLVALEDLRENVLSQNPELFASLAEGPLDNIARLRTEVADYLNPVAAAS